MAPPGSTKVGKHELENVPFPPERFTVSTGSLSANSWALFIKTMALVVLEFEPISSCTHVAPEEKVHVFWARVGAAVM